MSAHLFEEVLQIVKRVRSECPWDREQEMEDVCRYLLEEVYELKESMKKGDNAIVEEMGDLLFLILFLAQIGEQMQRFSMEDVLNALGKKMKRMHPHVFGEERAEESEDVLRRWCASKKSVVEGVPKSLPALLRANILQKRVAYVGFDHRSIEQVKEKVMEEVEEFLHSCKDAERMREEFGDVLFSLVNLARFLKIDAEDALHCSIEKFIKRFKKIEEQLRKEGKSPEQVSIEVLDTLWNLSKEES
jgi:tetrapyrrole methylase family protein/MazG family protein